MSCLVYYGNILLWRTGFNIIKTHFNRSVNMKMSLNIMKCLNRLGWPWIHICICFVSCIQNFIQKYNILFCVFVFTIYLKSIAEISSRKFYNQNKTTLQNKFSVQLNNLFKKHYFITYNKHHTVKQFTWRFRDYEQLGWY
jgi:hypothetical protein